MSDNSNATDSAPVLCKACSVFFGNSCFDNLCSQCYKSMPNSEKGLTTDNKLETPITKPGSDATPAIASNTGLLIGTGYSEEEEEVKEICKMQDKEGEKPKETETTRPIQKNLGRCFLSGCKGKIGMVKQIMNKCKCGYIYCDSHRLAESHNCDFDHMNFVKSKIATNNPLVRPSKINKI